MSVGARNRLRNDAGPSSLNQVSSNVGMDFASNYRARPTWRRATGVLAFSLRWSRHTAVAAAVVCASRLALHGFDRAFAQVGALACLVAVLLAAEAVAFRRRLETDAARQKLSDMVHWAQQKVETDPQGFPRLLDDKITSFSSYAKVLDEGSIGAKRRLAMTQLRLLAELLEDPVLNSTYRSANWRWAADWERQLHMAREVELRCTSVFPTIVAAAKASPEGAPRLYKTKGLHRTDATSIQHLANWCTDFLEQPRVKDFLEQRLASGKKGRTSGRRASRPAPPLEQKRNGRWRTACCAWMPNQAPPLDAGLELSDEEVDEDFALDRLWEGMNGLPRRRTPGQVSCYDDPDTTQTLIRGGAYLEDRIKVLSGPAMTKLVCLDIFRPSTPMVHYSASSRPGNIVRKLRDAGDRRFLFVTHWLVAPFNLATVWAVPEDADWLESREGQLFNRFRYMTDDERNARLKLIPRIVEAPWVVRQAIPETPVILGRLFPISYFHGDNYLEASISVSSSSTGRRAVGLMCGASKVFAVEVNLLIEGQAPEELPERVLSAFSVHWVDLDAMPER